MGTSLRSTFGAIALAAAVLLTACSAGGQPPSPTPGVRIFATTGEAPTSTPTAVPPAATPTPTPIPPTPTVTPGAVAYTLDFKTERRYLTMHVGEVLQLNLSSGVVGDWISGVDDARVLAPMSNAGNGVYQALVPGTTLVTAHVFIGCANVTPGVPCKPEHGLWYQTRVYVTA